MEKKDIFEQKGLITYFENSVFRNEWLQVSGHYETNQSDVGVWCGFCSIDEISNIFNDYGWDISGSDGLPGFEIIGDQTSYHSSLLNDGYEALLFYREFFGVEPDYVELSQEFILLNNLRYNRKTKSYYAMYEDGNAEEAVRYIDECTLSIKTKFIRKYAAAKQMAFLYFFDARTEFDKSLEENGFSSSNLEGKSKDFYWSFGTGNIDFDRSCFSRLLGKSIMYPQPIEKCGYWPYEAKRNYEEFIIGTDKTGEVIKFTSDPGQLNNYFNANPGSPMYLTPVFFKREVLQKYYENPELYTIMDGRLECHSLWGVEIDNHSNDYVSVYLGDLGRDLPESEQLHWKSYNIAADRRISDVTVKRDFFNVFAESDYIEHVFKRDYKKLNQKWKQNYGWDLYIPLPEDDEYLLKQIHVPLTESQSEFDQLVLELDKAIIESLNEKELSKSLKAGSIDISNMKGISKLEKWLQLQDVAGYESHIQFLRDLQELRSTGSGHIKGKSYKKAMNQLNSEQKTLVSIYEDLLYKADSYLKYMTNEFI